ncbi:MAG TPA: TRAP transporter TatT component family protein [Kofleriaceae bacterium]|nr:TRAP transporter TatT component family protein [Kofleriaceae bacterium]
MKCAALVLALAGCTSFIEGKAADTTYRILERGNVAVRRTADVELARDAMPGGIFQLQAFATAYPGHRGFKAMYAETLCQYANAFVFDDWEDASLGGRTADATRIATRLDTLLASCVDANLALLPTPWRAAHAEGGAAWKAVVAGAERRHVTQLLWIASADAVRLALDPMRGLARLDGIIAALARCIELAPGFHEADAELLLGTLYAGKSRFLGGPDGAAQFATAKKTLGDGALLVDVLYARGVLVAKQDRAAYTATLERVLAADVTKWPDRRLANELARIKARRYLAAVDLLVPRSESPTVK